MRGFVMALGLALAVAGCASPAQRIERKLVEVGVPQRVAECMGQRLSQQLSTSQLRQLDRMARLEGDRIGRARIEDIGRALAGAENPALMGEVIRTGVSCLI
ncbi:hypothetical protein [Polymorphobacter sp.]|uniref:hypothetical protein n=1 Tax=Polymorphobacter sp. TaxID=1909290 RepID=UPI003F70D82A